VETNQWQKGLSTGKGIDGAYNREIHLFVNYKGNHEGSLEEISLNFYYAA
jgi:hypothetical protein